MGLKGDWRYGLLTNDPKIDDNYEWFISNDAGKPYAYAVGEGTIGQYTGLKDKNGKEIYEGDIVTYKRGEQQKEEFYEAKDTIYFRAGGFILGVHSLSDWNNIDGILLERLSSYYDSIWRKQYFQKDFDIEVIGNIHENPELLNQ